jgi:hypothetical protein
MQTQYTAFAGFTRIAAGPLPEVAARALQYQAAGGQAALAVFGDADGKPVDLDLRGSLADALARLSLDESKYPLEEQPPADESAARGRGRPKLGVVAREVTLLPRHWEWLATQPGGASVALRKLVEAARKQGADREAARRARDTAYGVMSHLGGNLPGFEEATRALYAQDGARFATCLRDWPADLREYVTRLAAPAFAPVEARPEAQA